MAYLVREGEVLVVDGDQFQIVDEIPPGIYKIDYHKMRGIFLTKSEMKLTHGKIYSNSQSIADHVIESYKKNDPTKNMGVLLSGDKGLGKTLTSRLIVEQLVKDHPIIICSSYLPDLADFLSKIKNSVILMDEFEKFMGGNICGNDAEEEQSKQETLLSVLDGNTGSSGNLYILTVNNVYKLDDNLKSRPGRIRYHYRYVSENAEVVRAYCNDNLNDKSKTEEVVTALSGIKYVSMDIISSFVKEMNDFPNLSPQDILKYLNIENEYDGDYHVTIKVAIDGKVYDYCMNARDLDEIVGTHWYNRKQTREEKLARKKVRLNSEDEDEAEDEELPEHLGIDIDEDGLPTYIYGVSEIDLSYIDMIRYEWGDDEHFGLFKEEHQMKVLKATIRDDSYSKYMKKYDKTV